MASEPDLDLDPPPLGDGSTISERLELALLRLDSLRDRPATAAAIVVGLAVVLVGAWWLGRPGSVAPVEARIPYATSIPALGTAPLTAGTTVGAEPETILVHVAGAVVEPGIVALETGARIGDAVAAAGGPTADADLHQLNLAAPLTDGLQVRVPVAGEVVSPVGIGPATGAGAEGEPSFVDVNGATAAELEGLPGIGPALAAAIVEWRSSNGPFATADDLLAVPGIGPAKLAGFADHVVL